MANAAIITIEYFSIARRRKPYHLDCTPTYTVGHEIRCLSSAREHICARR
jgi:hypothetical protein